ncbi:MAG: hypothetical protein JJU18_01260 [Oceanicaulis sp.]|nr:hypothetical protein [Oceanicaulis sp.]
MGFIRIAAAWLAATAFMAVTGTAAQSAFVLAGLAKAGAPITPGDAAGMMLADLAGLAPLYGALIAIAFVIAFAAAALVVRLTALPRALVFGAAGLTAMAVMLALMEPVFFGVQPIAGARSLAGQAVQAFLGLAAGLIFARLALTRESTTA